MKEDYWIFDDFWALIRPFGISKLAVVGSPSVKGNFMCLFRCPFYSSYSKLLERVGPVISEHMTLYSLYRTSLNQLFKYLPPSLGVLPDNIERIVGVELRCLLSYVYNGY